MGVKFRWNHGVEPFETELSAGIDFFEMGGPFVSVVLVESGYLPPFAEEFAVVTMAVAKRRDEFAAGRRAAHAVLGRLGAAPAPLLPDRNRSPLWPSGVTGSIAHSGRVAIAATAWRRDVLSIGVDAEADEPLDHGLLHDILDDHERAASASWTAQLGHDAAKLVFSAKEAFYKCHHPIAATFLDFLDVRVDLRPHESCFSARIVSGTIAPHHAAIRQLEGRFFRACGHVFTMVIAPSAAPASSRAPFDLLTNSGTCRS